MFEKFSGKESVVMLVQEGGSRNGVSEHIYFPDCSKV